jgi:hypothetical protein
VLSGPRDVVGGWAVFDEKEPTVEYLMSHKIQVGGRVVSERPFATSFAREEGEGHETYPVDESAPHELLAERKAAHCP